MWNERLFAPFYLFLALSLLPGSSFAASAQCFNLVSEIQRNWIDIKRYLVPVGENVEGNPGSDQFVCVSRYATGSAMERRVSGSGNVRCFRHGGQGLGFCCDRSLNECAGLNPALFPDHFEGRQQKEDNYAPPESGWVKPPGDGEQWKSN
ncbi:MAG: hypothetical protein ISP91_14520 [Pseudomonadales bacterium]|nr:hypothetical protein [Pseudomonadales bacterium]